MRKDDIKDNIVCSVDYDKITRHKTQVEDTLELGLGGYRAGKGSCYVKGCVCANNRIQKEQGQEQG